MLPACTPWNLEGHCFAWDTLGDAFRSQASEIEWCHQWLPFTGGCPASLYLHPALHSEQKCL